MRLTFHTHSHRINQVTGKGKNHSSPNSVYARNANPKKTTVPLLHRLSNSHMTQWRRWCRRRLFLLLSLLLLFFLGIDGASVASMAPVVLMAHAPSMISVVDILRLRLVMKPRWTGRAPSKGIVTNKSLGLETPFPEVLDF